MPIRSDQLLALRRQEQQIHGYSASSRWYIYLSNAINYLALAETAGKSLDQFRNVWASVYNLFMMEHQAGEMENLALSRWVSAVGSDPHLQMQAQQFPTALLQATESAKQDVLWDTERKKWRDAKGLVDAWLQLRQGGKPLAPSKTCAYAFMIGRVPRNAVSHPTLNPSKAGIRKVYDLAAPYFMDLAQVAIRATIEHPQPGTTGRMIAYRFFLYPYLKNSDSFLSDYFLERLLPDAELAAFPEDEAKDQLKAITKELDARRSRLLPATDAAPTIADWCSPVLFPALGLDPQPGVTIVTEGAVYEPTFVLPANGAALQAEYKSKTAGQDLAYLIWVLPWRASLDSAASDEAFAGLSVMEVAQQALLQTDVPWAILTNGHHLRLLSKASAHRPRAYLEVDLDMIAARWTEAQARLAFRYMLCAFSQSSFTTRDAQGHTRLDRIVAESDRHGKEIGEELKQNVFKALEEVGDGFLYLMRQDHKLVRQWQQQTGSSMPIDQYLLSDDLFKTIYEESLALMYRLLFLFYAESRDLLPMHDELYRDTYSLEAIRDDIISVHDDPDPRRFYSAGNTDLDERLRELFRLVNHGLASLIPAYNGGLFDAEKHPFLESFRVGDFYLARAVDLVSRTRPRTGQTGGEGRKKVTYRDLDVRHLGEIYEGLLEYSAHIAPEEQVIFERTQSGSKYEEYVAASELSAGERRQMEQYRQAHTDDPDLPRVPAGCKVTGIKEKGQYFLVYGGKESKRRSTGSYYTPDYIVQYIIENTLGPLVRGENREGDHKGVPLTSAEILELKVLDPAMGSGHFLVAATEYLARAYGQGLIREGRDRDGVMSDAEFIHYKRMVAERCIYGVDINAMAVELAKLSMWLFTMDPHRPLSFLDHNFRRGNSIFGAFLGELARLPRFDRSGKPLPKIHMRSQTNLFAQRFMAFVPVMVTDVLNISRRQTESAQDVLAKKALNDAIEYIKQPFRNLAHLWMGTFWGDAAKDFEYFLTDIEAARASQSDNQFDYFHWEIEFPEVFFDEHGNPVAEPGFDCIIGNPPWISIKGKHGSHIYDDTALAYLTYSLNVNTYMPNAFEAFCLRAVGLKAQSGALSMIVPDRIAFNENYTNARKALIDAGLRRVNFKVPFPDVIVDTVVFECLGPSKSQVIRVGRYEGIYTDVSVEEIERDDTCVIPFIEHPLIYGIWKTVAVNSDSNLSDHFSTTSGFGGKSSEITAELVDPRQIAVRKGADIGRFRLLQYRYFHFHPDNITGRTTDTTVLGASPKILLRKTGDTLIAAFDASNCYPEQSLYFLFGTHDEHKLWCVLALLNSDLYTFLYRTKFVTNLDTTPQLKKTDLDRFWLPKNFPDFECERLGRELSATPGDEALIEELNKRVYDIFGIPHPMRYHIKRFLDNGTIA